jgi:Flp pilus assembly protein TadG
MGYWRKNRLARFLGREDGVVGVEMVILFPLLVLIVVGIVEFGHLWYVRQTLTNASREGARAAVVYEVDPVTKTIIDEGTRKNLATAAVTKYLTDTKFNDAWKTDITLPVGTATGDPLTVTVTDTSPSGGLLLLPKLLSAFQGIKVSAETTMRLE